jgi:hypothetical protein
MSGEYRWGARVGAAKTKVDEKTMNQRSTIMA